MRKHLEGIKNNVYASSNEPTEIQKQVTRPPYLKAAVQAIDNKIFNISEHN